MGTDAQRWLIGVMLAVGALLAGVGVEAASRGTRGAQAGVRGTASAPLNDTGITWGGEYPHGSNATCTSATADIRAQDCSHGRDATHNNDSDGHAGFSFTKIGADGAPLAIQNGTWDDGGSEGAGTKWSCVRDNVTGLVWEVKPADGGLRDRHWRYSWYDDVHNYSGNAGSSGRAWPCGNSLGGQPCNTQTYAAAVRATNLCGYTDWRMPTVKELEGIANLGLDRRGPALDTTYFPDIPPPSLTHPEGYYEFWSGSPDATFYNWAWKVDGGFADTEPRARPHCVRVVRGGK